MEKKFKSKYIGKELITNLGDKYKITEYNNHKDILNPKIYIKLLENLNK